MTILSAQTIYGRTDESPWSPTRLVIKPFEGTTKQFKGMSYGLSACGYDIRLGKIDRDGYVFEGDKPGGNKTWKKGAAQSWLLKPGDFILCSSLEYFEIPNDIAATVLDKSTLARRGVALQNTILEPGWRGYITLEVSNHGPEQVRLLVGQPIAQVVFNLLDAPTALPYTGKYQDQGAAPQEAILPEDNNG